MRYTVSLPNQCSSLICATCFPNASHLRIARNLLLARATRSACLPTTRPYFVLRTVVLLSLCQEPELRPTVVADTADAEDVDGKAPRRDDSGTQQGGVLVCGVLVCGVLVCGVCCAVCYLFVNECIV